MNYYAVKALEARVLQYIGDYKNAAIAAKVVTDQIGEKGKVFSWTNVTTVLANMDYSFFITDMIQYHIRSSTIRQNLIDIRTIFPSGAEQTEKVKMKISP